LVLTLYALGLLLAGLLGTVMGVNRTFRTRENESRRLQLASTIAGVLMVAVAVYSLVAGGATVAGARYVVLFMLILGLSLSARWLESIPVTVVLILLAGLAILIVLAQGGMPQSLAELLQKQNLRKFIIIAVIVVVAAVVLMASTVEKLMDLVLDVLGQGLVVTALSLIGAAHAVVALVFGDGRGLLRFL
jgi:hypothetical protein